jgi:hypothetical protein
MFNPTNIDEVCVQETHLEARGKNAPREGSKKPFSNGHKGKRKFKGNGKNNASVKKEGEKISCKHCSKDGHDEDNYWKLHLEMRPKNFNNKTKPKIVATTQHDLGSDSGDEKKSQPWVFKVRTLLSVLVLQVVASMKLNMKKK